ncbi:MAG: ATP-grasp domain-containing protein [Clostridia bacterium]|nr:ATP-grasp domain-containing protein [Clostridia bacterium]
MKKALVLCGGIPQIELLNNLRSRGYYTILADMNEKVLGRQYADKFYPVSVLDVEAVERVARTEQVDFVITVCADQVLQVVAEVSEHLNLPCYIDFDTAVKVSQKTFMKKVFLENGIPTSKYVIADEINEAAVSGLTYPLIVKPVDSYSSRGVVKVENFAQLADAFSNAKRISRTHRAIVEEYVEGSEISVDVYVSHGKAKVLCSSNLDKIPSKDRFVICRTRCPAKVSDTVSGKIADVCQRIADAFGLTDSPMLVQMICDGEKISVVEFCARTGGGDKYRLIKKKTGFDVIDAVVELTVGNKPELDHEPSRGLMVINEFLYARRGVFDHLEGFEELLAEGVISEYYCLKAKGTSITGANSSGDRAAYFTVEADNEDALLKKHKTACDNVKAVNEDGDDILRHDWMRV